MLVEAIPDRIWGGLDQTGECWLWTRCRDESGYGQTWISGKFWKVHRLIYTDMVGPIPEGLQLDHLCRVRHCANPEHLEAVTPRENVMRGLTPARFNSEKTVCKHGHALDAENTYRYVYKGKPHRACRRCKLDRLRASRASL